MSFDIDWDNIKQNGLSNIKLKEKLNNYLKENGDTLLPNYIKNTYIEIIDIGDKPPEICLKDITEPLPSIYESLKEDYIEQRYEEHEYEKENIDFEILHNNLDSQLILDLKYIGNFQMVMKADLCVNYPNENFVKLPLKLYISDLKIHSLILLAYLKDVKIRSKTANAFIKKTGSDNISLNDEKNELEEENNDGDDNESINKAIFSILCDVKDDNIELDGTIPNFSQIMQLRNSNNTPSSMGTPTIGESNNNSSVNVPINNNQTERVYFIRNIAIRTEIGEGINVDSDRSILRNIQDLEGMIVDLLRKFIRDEICYPNWLEFDI